jgi:hypothetical protein
VSEISVITGLALPELLVPPHWTLPKLKVKVGGVSALPEIGPDPLAVNWEAEAPAAAAPNARTTVNIAAIFVKPLILSRIVAYCSILCK